MENWAKPILLNLLFSNQPVKFNTSLYILVSDVVAAHEIFYERNVRIDHHYGMRNFDIYDISSIKITFGTFLKKFK